MKESCALLNVFLVYLFLVLAYFVLKFFILFYLKAIKSCFYAQCDQNFMLNSNISLKLSLFRYFINLLTILNFGFSDIFYNYFVLFVAIFLGSVLNFLIKLVNVYSSGSRLESVFLFICFHKF